MASRSHVGHWPRLRHGERVPSLETPQQESGLKASRERERRSLNLPVKPAERLIFTVCHNRHICKRASDPHLERTARWLWLAPRAAGKRYALAELVWSR